MNFLKPESKTSFAFNIVFFAAIFLCVLSFSYEHVVFFYDSLSYHCSLRNLRTISAILLTIKLVYDVVKKRIRMPELIVFILLVPLVVYYITNFYDFDIDTMRFLNITLLFILSISGSDINYNVIIKFVLFSMFISYLSILILYLLGNLSTWHIASADGRYRNFVGFSWSDISYRFMFIVFYYFYLRKELISNIELTIILVANFILFYITGARFCFLIILLVLLFAILLKYCDHMKKALQLANRFLLAFSIAVPILSILLYISYNPIINWMYHINGIFSGRLQLGNEAIATHGISLFGNYIEFVGGFGQNGYYDFVDSGYLNFLLIYGILAFILLVLVLFYFSMLICKKNDTYMMVIFILILLFSITDLGITELISNYLFFILSYKNSKL